MKPSLPQGTRDFGPDVVRKRQFILNTIKNVFELYGFQPLETPAMENLETLMGKYGDEGDKLIFKVLNNGSYFDFENWFNTLDLKSLEVFNQPLRDIIPDSDWPEPRDFNDEKFKIFNRKVSNGLLEDITDKALRYDLTIPFARYVAINHNKLAFPFKRYQIQPVWRGDKPQRGRYREFYQCDADVVGSNSLLNEVELTNIYAEVFQQLKIPVEIRLNSRKILAALAEVSGGADQMMDITIAIDKLDKIGLEKVKEELSSRHLSNEQIAIIEKYLSITGSNEEKLAAVKELYAHSETGKQGIKELESISNSNLTLASTSNLLIDLTLARGLNYYTGTIFEIKATGVNMGSIGGGGRYDDLTGLFGVPNIPGVGISFGVDRIYDVMEELNLFPSAIEQGTKVLFFNLGEEESKAAYGLLQQVRQAGIPAEIFHEAQKFDKQFKYAEKKGIPFIIIIGSKEIAEQTAVVKDLRTGTQQKLAFDDLPQFSFI